MPTSNIFTSVLNPQSIAVVGASRSPEKVGYQVVKNIITAGFKGKLYPVNPHASNILGLLTHPTLTGLPEVPELVIIVTPAAMVPIILEEAGRLKIPAAIIISAGFAEIGFGGRRLQQDLIKIAADYPIRVIGPNCLGVLNTSGHLNATFGPPLPKPGNILLISQSGAMVTGILDWARQHHLGLSHAITFGNRIDVNENEALEFALKTPGIKTVLVYLESFHHAPTFFSLCSRITPKKPVILLKGGQTQAGQTASASHTAALATDYTLIQAFSRQTGVILSKDFEHFLNTAAFLNLQTPVKGLELAIITNAGGPGVVSTDKAIAAGLEIVPLTPNTRNQLETALNISPGNPIDILGDALPNDFFKALQIVDQDKIQDATLVIITPQTTTKPLETARVITRFSKTSHKPVYVVLIGGQKLAKAYKILERAQIPVFHYPREAINLIATIAKYYHHKQNLYPFPKKRRSPIDHRTRQSHMTALATDLNLDHTFKLLKAYRVPLPDYRIVDHIDEVPEALAQIHRPAVIKTAGLHLAHKKSLGGVITGVMTVSAARLAFRRLQKLHPQVLFQRTVYASHELIVGAKRDPQFGPFLVVGLGGSLTDLLNDRNYVFLPAYTRELKVAFQQTKAFEALKHQTAAINSFYDLMRRIGHIILDFPLIEEIEVNPVMITPNHALAADIKIILGQTGH